MGRAVSVLLEPAQRPRPARLCADVDPETGWTAMLDASATGLSHQDWPAGGARL